MESISVAINGFMINLTQSKLKIYIFSIYVIVDSMSIYLETFVKMNRVLFSSLCHNIEQQVTGATLWVKFSGSFTMVDYHTHIHNT